MNFNLMQKFQIYLVDLKSLSIKCLLIPDPLELLTGLSLFLLFGDQLGLEGHFLCLNLCKTITYSNDKWKEVI